MKHAAKFSARAGDILHLDQVYSWQGLLPADSYENVDREGNECELGDHVVFHTSVSIKAVITVGATND
ncbi:hypothetical protein [Marinimicrobium sp. ABcell2]|uniref:hypothetical protein n=1 Tax=Marinimicrobium sp. ABcell2 TaxID=3069751 RepID=UPI0027AE8EEE|nr:hypothetical protein [Marinimicrobium sp. ABcell2]MDQ2077548.1 hypothetical protein [Marinimicrobium sp. ABcell2]